VVMASGEVLHVKGLDTGGAAQLLHHLDSTGSLKPGDAVTLVWNVSAVKHSYGTVAELGAVMFSRYLLPFEATSILLLVAIVGAVVVAKGKI
jgi:NADH-quinone oxidoreductase subunit J